MSSGLLLSYAHILCFDVSFAGESGSKQCLFMGVCGCVGVFNSTIDLLAAKILASFD
jgi:hypothetical protein